MNSVSYKIVKGVTPWNMFGVFDHKRVGIGKLRFVLSDFGWKKMFVLKQIEDH